MYQDISTEDGENLHMICQTIMEEGPLVFTPLAEDNRNRKYQEQVPVYVKKWMTFRELVMILRASLQDIVDRYLHSSHPAPCLATNKKSCLTSPPIRNHVFYQPTNKKSCV